MIILRKNHFRRNKWNITLVVLFLVLCYLLYYYGYINIANIDRGYHINLLTINSIFIGFLFTGLGIMAGIADKDRIAKLDRAGYMDNYYNSIYIGIIFLMVSISISTLGFLSDKVNHISLIIYIQQFSLVGGIIFFVKAIWNIFKIIGKIRQSLYSQK